MSANAYRYDRKARRDRPEWVRSNRAKKDRPGDMKVRNRAILARQRASRYYKGGLV